MLRNLYFDNELKTRKVVDGPMVLEGYFLKFNKETELWPGFYEQIHPDALTDLFTSERDVKALFDHQSSLVLGSRDNKTLEMKIDEVGLWAQIIINERDSEAVDIYERVSRGDISHCSFGFSINSGGETYIFEDDGSTHVTLTDITVRELSIVAFPAYIDTDVSARKEQFETSQKEKLEKIRNAVLEKYL